MFLKIGLNYRFAQSDKYPDTPVTNGPVMVNGRNTVRDFNFNTI